MYIKTNGKTFPCTSFSEMPDKTVFMINGEVSALGDTVQLVSDDGFVLFACKPNDFARVIYENGTLTLTNEPEPVVPDLESIKRAKLAELAQVCNATITAGCDVTLSDGTTGHISMKDEDQINLMSAQGAVQVGALGYPYHLDGDLCRVYVAADITIMATAAMQHKIYHTTYCNHLNVWVRRSETVEAVQGITYGAALPFDLADNMQEVLGHVG